MRYMGDIRHMTRTDYHPYIPRPGSSRAAGKTPRPYTQEMLQRRGTQAFAARVKQNMEQPFKGITTDGKPIRLLVENSEFFREATLDYDGGERYPHLEKVEELADLLSPILAPRTP